MAPETDSHDETHDDIESKTEGEEDDRVDQENDRDADDEGQNGGSILPTPSCAGSMDSLSSSSTSSAERQLSFTTFGNATIDATHIADKAKRKSPLDTTIEEQQPFENTRQSDDSVEELRTTDTATTVAVNKLSNRERGCSNRQSDSTDEDSGIESIMRIATEKA